jgi:serine/threonine protein kinase
MGEVYKARDPRLNRLVAVKVLSTTLQDDPAALARFEREARTLAGLNHPNIVAIHDVGRADGTSFVVTELLEGETLSALLARGPLPLARALAISLQIAKGLVAAHDKGIIHRDLKPSNVMIGKGDHAKLLDFGLAKDLKLEFDGSATDAAVMPGHTLRGTILGTVGYMSPEQVRGEGTDARSDLFTLGVLLLEMLTGKQAFTGDSAVEVLHAILREDPLDGCELSSELRPIVERLLAKDPLQRFQTARDLVFVLERTGGASSVQTSPVTQRRFWVLPLIAALSLVGGVLGNAFIRKPTVCTFKQITQNPTMITGAKFLGESRVVFSQVTALGEEELFEVDISRPEAPRSLGIRGACVVSASPEGEIAVILRQTPLQTMGRLAIIPAAGGAPRPIMDGIAWADWGPNGHDLILHHWKYQNGPCQVVEYPKGNILFRAPYWETGMLPPRLSRDRRYLAIPTMTPDDRNLIVILDLVKQTRREIPLNSFQLETSTLTYTWKGRDFYLLQTNNRMGTSATLLQLGDSSQWQPVPVPMPGVKMLFDISPGGRMLVAQGTDAIATRWQDFKRSTEKFIANQIGSISQDGTHLMTSPFDTLIPEIWVQGGALPVFAPSRYPGTNPGTAA